MNTPPPDAHQATRRLLLHVEQFAAARGDGIITIDHLLWGTLRDPAVVAHITASGCPPQTINRLSEDIRSRLGQGRPYAARTPASSPQDMVFADSARHLLTARDEHGAPPDPLPLFQTIIRMQKQVLDALGQDAERLAPSLATAPAALEATLREAVMGQDEAMAILARGVAVGRAGLRLARRPVFSALLAGPTGVGKTETARALAAALQVPLIQHDMSEYQEPHNVARIIGSPPGYVGHDQGGPWVTDLLANPKAVLLVDEIEKAHPDIAMIFLQMLDRAALTDGQGRSADLTGNIILFTTNAGVASAHRPIGFHPAAPAESGTSMRHLADAFPPEFRNRLDAIVMYRPLAGPALVKIVKKIAARLAQRLADRQVTLVVDDAAVMWLAHRGADPDMGARPLVRLVESTIGGTVVELMASGVVHPGATVCVTHDGTSLRVTPQTPGHGRPRRHGEVKPTSGNNGPRPRE